MFEDEFSLSNTATTNYKWSEKGKQPKVKCKQRSRERQTVMGSVNYETGQVTVNFNDKGNYKTFKQHIKKVIKTYKHTSKIIMVVDNVRYHHAKALKTWIATLENFELIYLPPYSPELNPIERVWWYMRKKITHNRHVNTLKERKKAFWMMFSHYQKPNQEILNICAINY